MSRYPPRRPRASCRSCVRVRNVIGRDSRDLLRRHPLLRGAGRLAREPDVLLRRRSAVGSFVDRSRLIRARAFSVRDFQCIVIPASRHDRIAHFQASQIVQQLLHFRAVGWFPDASLVLVSVSDSPLSFEEISIFVGSTFSRAAGSPSPSPAVSASCVVARKTTI